MIATTLALGGVRLRKGDDVAGFAYRRTSIANVWGGATFVIATGIGMPALSRHTTAAKLLENCTAAIALEADHRWTSENKITDATAYGHCFGFVESAWQAAPLPGKGPAEFCISGTTSALQLAQEFVRYAHKHPEEASNMAVLVVWRALGEAFPCNRQQPKAKK
jgi:Rap1a immunity proteins